MKCDRAADWIPQMLDRELGVAQRWWLRHHIAGCAACATELKEQQAMQAALRDGIAYYRAPPELAAHIVSNLPRETPPLPSRPWFRLPAIGMAGTGLAGALAGVGLMLLVHGGAPDRAESGVVTAVIDSHIASLMASHLTDVQTSDQHTVKPWLSAHLDVSPAVGDYKAEGFPLVGGRIDYIDGHPAAAVVYHYREHVINLFAWAAPGEPDLPPHSEHRQGFNLVTWRSGGIRYFAVSDAEMDELEKFSRLVMQHPT